jgi:hypothetical protein
MIIEKVEVLNIERPILKKTAQRAVVCPFKKRTAAG